MTLSLIALAYAAASSGIGWAIVFVAGGHVLSPAERRRYLTAWIVVTLSLFLIPIGGVFLIWAAVFPLFFVQAEEDRIPLFAFLLATAPAGAVEITELSIGINYLLNFTFALVIGVVLLGPVAARHLGKPMRGAAGPDGFFIAFLVGLILMSVRAPTFTSFLRDVTVWILTAAIPYFAFSRGIRTSAQLRRVMAAAVACFCVVGIIGIVGSVVGWQIYDVAERRLFESSGMMVLRRAGLMRSGGTLGTAPIAFGTMMMIGACFVLAFARDARAKWHGAALFAACCAGLLGSISRGPMVGLVFGLVAYQLTRPKPAEALIKAGMLGFAALLPLVLFTDTGRALLEFIPFVGTGDAGNVTYRQDLARIGWQVGLQNPLFGDPDFLEAPEMQELVTGLGIIDLVNTYLFWFLRYGAPMALLPIIGIAVTLARLLSVSRKLPTDDPESAWLRDAGGALFAALAGFAITIATVSLGGTLPTVLWVMFGLSVAYLRVAAAHAAAPKPAEAPSPVADAAPGPAPTPQPSPGPQPAWVPSVAPSGASLGAQSAADLDIDAIVNARPVPGR